VGEDLEPERAPASRLEENARRNEDSAAPRRGVFVAWTLEPSAAPAVPTSKKEIGLVHDRAPEVLRLEPSCAMIDHMIWSRKFPSFNSDPRRMPSCTAPSLRRRRCRGRSARPRAPPTGSRGVLEGEVEGHSRARKKQPRSPEGRTYRKSPLATANFGAIARTCMRPHAWSHPSGTKAEHQLISSLALTLRPLITSEALRRRRRKAR